MLGVLTQQLLEPLPGTVDICKALLEHGREPQEQALAFGIRVRRGRDTTLVHARELLPRLDEEQVLLEGAKGGGVARVDGKLLEQTLNARVVHGRRVGLHD